MSYIYKTKGTCSTEIELDLDGNIVRNVKFTGGCNGNLQAIPKLVEGLTVEQVEEKIGGIKCGFKNTSCGDQLAKACREAYEAQKLPNNQKCAWFSANAHFYFKKILLSYFPRITAEPAFLQARSL